MYAIIETGGKQYRVEQGQTLFVEKVALEPGAVYEATRILAVEKEDGEFVIGQPAVEGAKVELKVVRHSKGQKVIVFKYKPKKNYRRKKGHRQPFTEVTVEKIEA